MYIKLAGVGGIEPTDVGVKVPCLNHLAKPLKVYSILDKFLLYKELISRSANSYYELKLSLSYYFGRPGGIRTPITWIWNPLFYQLELPT